MLHDPSLFCQVDAKKSQANHNSGRAQTTRLGHLGYEVKRVMPGPLKKVRPHWRQGPEFGPGQTGMAKTQ